MGQDTIEPGAALASVDDACEAIIGIVERSDVLVTSVSDIEPMMGGWSARVVTDGIPQPSYEFTRYVNDERALRTEHGTKRTASSGTCARGDQRLAWQGEIEQPKGGFASGAFRIWIGLMDTIPSDVAYAFGREHDRVVGEAILERMNEDAVFLNAADSEAVMSTPHARERLAEIRRVLAMLDGSAAD